MRLTMFGADTTFNFTEDASVHETVVKQRMQDGTWEVSAFQHLNDNDKTSLTASTEMSKTTTRVLSQIRFWSMQLEKQISELLFGP